MDSIEEILGNSVFYPACREDGIPVKYFNEHFTKYGIDNYVYVDYAMNADRLRNIQDGFRYYHVVEQIDLAEGDLVAPGTDYRKHASILTDEEIVRQKEVVYGMYRDSIRPFARLIEYERNDDADTVRGPEHFTLLYIGAEAVATYAALYRTRSIAPKAIAIIAPGTGFGGNYTDFYDPDSALLKLIRQGESQPEYIMFGYDRVMGFDVYLENFDNLRQLDIMAIFPNLHYSGNYQRHSANEIQGLPESCRAVMTRLDHLGEKYDDFVKQENVDIDRVEQHIYNLINAVSPDADLTDGVLWRIFHLIQIWGGRMGKIYNDKNFIDKKGVIIENYNVLVRTCLTVDREQPRQEIYKTVYDALKSFCKLNGMGVAYASKHTRFWLSKSMGRDDALPIYDSIMAKGVVGERYGASLSRIMCYWAAMDNKSSSEGVSLFSLERQLFDYFRAHPNFVGDAKNDYPKKNAVDYDTTRPSCIAVSSNTNQVSRCKDENPERNRTSVIAESEMKGVGVVVAEMQERYHGYSFDIGKRLPTGNKPIISCEISDGITLAVGEKKTFIFCGVYSKSSNTVLPYMDVFDIQVKNGRYKKFETNQMSLAVKQFSAILDAEKAKKSNQ